LLSVKVMLYNVMPNIFFSASKKHCKSWLKTYSLAAFASAHQNVLSRNQNGSSNLLGVSVTTAKIVQTKWHKKHEVIGGLYKRR
jgi:hypothetical protein